MFICDKNNINLTLNKDTELTEQQVPEENNLQQSDVGRLERPRNAGKTRWRIHALRDTPPACGEL